MKTVEWGKQRLEEHLATGTIRWSNKEACYLGRASDGVEVNLGDDEDTVSQYLWHRPDPTQW